MHKRGRETELPYTVPRRAVLKAGEAGDLREGRGPVTWCPLALHCLRPAAVLFLTHMPADITWAMGETVAVQSEGD